MCTSLDWYQYYLSYLSYYLHWQHWLWLKRDLKYIYVLPRNRKMYISIYLCNETFIKKKLNSYSYLILHWMQLFYLIVLSTRSNHLRNHFLWAYFLTSGNKCVLSFKVSWLCKMSHHFHCNSSNFRWEIADL